MGIFHHAIRADFTVITDNAVFNDATRANLHAMAQRDVTFDDNVSINFNISPVNERTAQVKTRRIAQHHARQQQFFCLLGLVNAFQTGKLQTVVDAFDFTQTIGMNGRDFTTFLISQRNDIGDIVFTLRIVIGQFRQPALHVRAVCNQDPGIDFLDLTLFLAGIFMLNDAGHFAVLTRDATIAARIVQLNREQANSPLGFGIAQAL